MKPIRQIEERIAELEHNLKREMSVYDSEIIEELQGKTARESLAKAEAILRGE